MNVKNKGVKSSTFHKYEKKQKICLTKGRGCGRIVKLSQRDVSRRSAESRPREGRELAQEGERSEVRKKDFEKNQKRT